MFDSVGVTVGRIGRRALRPGMRLAVAPWRSYSRLFLVSDTTSWTVSWEMRELGSIVQRIGIRVGGNRWLPVARNQAVFFGSHLMLLEREWSDRPHRVGTAYFHGVPGTGVPGFDSAYRNLRQHHERIHRVQVTHREMLDLVLSSGIASEKVFVIPIGVNLSMFHLQTPERRNLVREKYGIPRSAVVVGSFQKDGVGWGEGKDPKLVKGPDVFLRVVELLRPRVPELYVLLSGPARQYVKSGLEALNVPYSHVYVEDYLHVGDLYQALDVYVVASRQEGGPKAVLESMASGVPLVTTRVGQAMGLVVHGQNGWMVDVEDADGLAHWAQYVIERRSSITDVLSNGRRTAQANSYKAQVPAWAAFMRGFVEW